MLIKDINMKQIDTLVEDIYDLMKNKDISEEVNLALEVDRFGENVKTLIGNIFTEKREQNPRLRMSNIGKGDRYLWNEAQRLEGEELTAPTLIKFMYGHLIEEMLIFLIRTSGHKVTHEQEEVTVEGIKGHIDCFIDGKLMDIKSASTFGFKKFKEGTLKYDDPFGYIDQIKGYAHGLDETDFGWLAMDKQHGHLTVLQYGLNDLPEAPSVVDRIKHLKDVVASPDAPERCFKDVPDGKSGNRKLSINCSYCKFKAHCWPDLRTFYYSTGPKYLTYVAREPRVYEAAPTISEGALF